MASFEDDFGFGSFTADKLDAAVTELIPPFLMDNYVFQKAPPVIQDDGANQKLPAMQVTNTSNIQGRSASGSGIGIPSAGCSIAVRGIGRGELTVGHSAAVRGRGRGERTAGRSKGRIPSKLPKPPAALQAHLGWTKMPNVDLQTSSFAMKNDLIDQMLSVRVQHYIKNIRSRLGEKLKLNEMELTELNIFSLLMSSSFDFMLEYTNESMTQKGIMKATQAEFRRFIGTLLLSTTFNLSTDYSWSLMEQISNNKVMMKDRFNEILYNLRGYEVSVLNLETI